MKNPNPESEETVSSLLGQHMTTDEKAALNIYREWLDTIENDDPNIAIHTKHLLTFELMFKLADRIALRAEMVKLILQKISTTKTVEEIIDGFKEVVDRELGDDELRDDDADRY